jgi:hypothetical protein
MHHDQRPTQRHHRRNNETAFLGYLHLLLAAIAGAIVGVVLWQMIPWTGSSGSAYSSSSSFEE